MSVPEVSSKSISELVSLDGRTALVTGGARGLGKAIVRRLAEAGASVVIGDIEDALAATAAAEIAAEFSRPVVSTRLDVSDEVSVAAAADLAVAEFGSLDIWVNNAGIFPAAPLLHLSAAEWDRVFAVNARGTFLGAREAARRMDDDRGGVIVNVVSTAGFRGTSPALAAYVSSKHAVRGLTRQLALELAPRGIRVLGVAPAYVPTEGNQLAQAAGPGDQDVPTMQPGPLGRLGVPDDIARVALFCASDLSIFLTGSTLLADGGTTA